MAEQSETFVSFLIKPALFLTDPGKRIFLPFLVVALLMSIGVIAWQQRRSGFSVRKILRVITAKQVWLSPSAFLDYKLFLLNGLLRALAPSLLSTAAVGAVVSSGFVIFLGENESSAISRTSIAVAYTLSLFVVGDLSRFVVHLLLHRIPFLWEFHKIHHSATVLNPITVYRTHPVEVFLYGLRSIMSAGLVTGVFFYFFKGDLNGYDVLGINLFGFAFNLLGSNLRHSHIWLSYGKTVEHLFISPAQHQIHHSTDAIHYNRNYGSCLAIWDWAWNSLYVTTGSRESLTYGLDAEEHNHDGSFWSAIKNPILTACGVAPRKRVSQDPN
jgi:sterol desaturase/sphingolipid hydroxylase (fatty acid hydroxylase superfamily)